MPLVQLPATTIKLITSTQIITSVASVVKELMENSLDAGAKNIDIKLENNGVDLIEVRDDGCGIQRCDASNMALPSHTSKITDYTDLDKLESYGFRGEALNALCQVASVSITTRTCEDEYAMTYTMDSSGSVLVSKPSSLGKGTVVIAKRLFYNLPVRKQYLTSNRRRIGDELKRVESFVKSLAVIHPQLRVTFCHDKCLLWQKSACQNLRQSLMQVASHFVTNQLEELSMKESELSIEMLIPKKTVKNIQSLCQSNNEAIMIYINNRPICYKKLEKLVLKYVSEHFSEQLPLHRYPVCLISIVILPSELDVNLEPNKTQVMLKQEDEVLSKIEMLLVTYYETVAQKSDEIDTPGSLTASSSSETIQSEPSDVNINKVLDEDEPTASKRVKLDILNSALEDKQLSDIVQNTCVEITSLGKEVLLNVKDSNQSIAEPVEKIYRHCQVERPRDESLTTNASVAVNDGWTIIETNSVTNSDVTTRNVTSEISVPQNLGSSQNVNCRILDSGISRFDKNVSSSISNSENVGFGQNTNSEISENTGSVKLGNSTSKFFSSKFSSTKENAEIQQKSYNNKEVVMLENSGTTVLESKSTNGTGGVIGKSSSVINEEEIPQDRANFNDSLFDVERISDLDDVDLNFEFDFHLPTIPEKTSGKETLCETDIGNELLAKEPESTKNEDLFKVADQAMEKWSMGLLKGQNEKILQGSTVMLPQKTIDSFNISYQSVSSQMGQKDQSAFTKFSRDERPKILKEFPSIAFTRVAELLVERWRALPEEGRMKYEQIAKELDEKRKSKMQQMGMQKLDTKQLNIPKNKVELKTSKDPPKEESKFQPKSDLKVEKKFKRPKRNKQMFEVSVHSLKQVCLGSYMKPTCDASSWSLIGKLKSSGEWLYKKDKELGLVCHWGLQETVLYHRLMVDHIVPLKKLDSKILLDESLLGADLWNVLLSLNKTYDVVDNAVIITSDVISKNGFKIEVQEGRSSCMLTEVASTINFYGVNDLKDVLKLVKNHGCGSLEKCRNLRVMSYIRDEAVRIVRQCSTVMEQDTLQDLINYWQLNLSHLGATCLHRKPIFHVLKDLSKEN